MTNINTILNQRVKKNDSPKMSSMAKQSASGNLSSFSGMFASGELSEQEKKQLEALLKSYTKDDEQKTLDHDLYALISITSEIKAINNQAALLHGERIKKAHDILLRYADGAFTAWLISAYGNRQTPYNLMQYYDFYESLPRQLRPQVELMPRQAVYVLASRAGSHEQKEEIVKNYKGETKVEVLSLIRQTFPLAQTDKRQQEIGETILSTLVKIVKQIEGKKFSINASQKKRIQSLLQQIKKVVEFS